MGVSNVVVVECDHREPKDADGFKLVRCTALWTGAASEPRDMVLATARRHGWVRVGGYYYCPAHAGTHSGPRR